MNPHSVRRLVLWQWGIGVAGALIMNRLWPPSAVVFCLVAVTAPMVGFGAPVANRSDRNRPLYVRISVADAILYAALLLILPAVDMGFDGLLCPPIATGIWLMGLTVVLFLLPGRWYERMNRIAERREKFALEELEKRENIRSILRVAFVGSYDSNDEMSPKRRWIFVISIGMTMLSVCGIMWIAFMARIVPWLPILAAPGAVIAMLSVLTAIGVLGLETIDKVTLHKELLAARKMQMGLMPTSDPVVSGFDISGICLPASEVGGDFFDYVWLDASHTKLGIALADVSGKAMKAAMTAVMTSGMICREVDGGASPKEVLTRINKPMYLKLDRRMFTAMSFAVIDTVKRKLSFSNAGQMHPLLLRKGSLRSLKVRGVHLPLGIQEHVPYGEVSEKLAAGDVLVFYTDGLPESMNSASELFGFERIESALLNLVNAGTSRTIVDRLLAEARSFAGSAKQHDDMTVVVVRVL